LVNILPSGQQHEINWAGQHATIVEVGGGIRRYEVGDRAVLDPYRADAMCDGAHGAPLIPWPNRLADGRWVAEVEGEHRRTLVPQPAQHLDERRAAHRDCDQAGHPG